LAPVLDASALLAHLRDEPGADVVAEAIASGAVISTVNLAEVFSCAADRGADPAKLAALARRLDAPALTADTDWQGVAHGVELRPIR
jgi:ribonuclease VapC